MQKVGSEQQDEQVWKQSFFCQTTQPDYSHLNILPQTRFSIKQTPFPPYQNVSLVRLDTAIALAVHLAPAPAAAIVAPARAAAYVFTPFPPFSFSAGPALNCRANTRIPRRRPAIGKQQRAGRAPVRPEVTRGQWPCSPTVNSSRLSVICHKRARRAGVVYFCAVRVREMVAVSCR
ncbi:hypothetical protein E4U61_006766 [Claviceps capensis]|nr:hypothetical protein E4U61_006766 [Claviceps capensis]